MFVVLVIGLAHLAKKGPLGRNDSPMTLTKSEFSILRGLDSRDEAEVGRRRLPGGPKE